MIITSFWWQKTESIYAVVENKNDLYNGFIYRFDPKNLKTPFIPTVSKNFVTFNFYHQIINFIIEIN
jgi:hypothetical protein